MSILQLWRERESWDLSFNSYPTRYFSFWMLWKLNEGIENYIQKLTKYLPRYSDSKTPEYYKDKERTRSGLADYERIFNFLLSIYTTHWVLMAEKGINCSSASG